MSVDGRHAEVFFFAGIDELPNFWRGLFAREDVDEAGFFEFAAEAFERLVLAPSLAFRRFDGNYRDTRDKVVQVLAAINDHFPVAIEQSKGLPYDVQASLGRFGVDISPESPGTRQSKTRMADRVVRLDGEEYVCEWHAKLDRNRNRIHFALPDTRIGGRMVVGIFVDHLAT